MKKKLIIAGIVVLAAAAIIVTVVLSPTWSKRSFEAVVQETVVQRDGEVCLIVERITEIYHNPMNSLHVSEDTELIGIDSQTINIGEIKPGDTVRVSLKDSFIEEIPFYYPTVYKIIVINFSN